MKQIDRFVDSVYENVGGNNKEIQELKAEMKSHLLEAVHDLKNEGKPEQEAIEIAIDRFGGEQELHSIVLQLFRAQKTFAKWILYIAITFLVLGSTVAGFLFATEVQYKKENHDIATTIFTILQNKEVISDDLKEQIKALVRGTDQISKVEIYKTKDVRSITEDGGISYFNHEAIPTYQYERAVWANEWIDYYYHFSQYGDEWFVHFKSKHFATIFDILLSASIAIYVVLFTIWATINAYHHKRLNIGWICAFALLNVLGYLVYRLLERRFYAKPV
ncbi:MAG: hypothetical protein K0Q73_4378 [Paenibacillus sp.]|nr:hypothetical protein [Paenibacillus sp.]